MIPLAETELNDVYGKVKEELHKIEEQIRIQCKKFQQNLFATSRSDQDQIELCDVANKNQKQQSQEIQILTQELKCKEWQITIFKEKLMNSLQINNNYMNDFKQISESIELLNKKMKSMFFNEQCLEQSERHSYNEEFQINHVTDLLKIMEKSILKAAAKIQSNRETQHPTIKALHEEIQKMNIRNQQLVSFIDERKKYSEKLKLRIKQLKDQINTMSKKAEQNQQYLQQLQKWEITLDLKFRKRDQLINMIKILIYKLRKLQSNCQQAQPIDLNQLYLYGKPQKHPSASEKKQLKADSSRNFEETLLNSKKSLTQKLISNSSALNSTHSNKKIN